MRLEGALLICGVVVPVLYYTALIGTSLFWPGYSHVTQYASDLGSAASPRPWLFNSLIIAAGAAAMLASVGFFLALKHLGGRTLPMLWALAGKPVPRLKLLLGLVFVVSGALILIMFDVGGLHLVRRANVGLWQRAYSLSVIPWIGVMAWALLRAGATQEHAQ